MTDNNDVHTQEGFRAALESDDPAAFVAAVSNFTDADRKRFSKFAQEFTKETRKALREHNSWSDLSPAEREQRLQNYGKIQAKWNSRLAMAHLGLLAVGPKSSVLWELPDTDSQTSFSGPQEYVSPHEKAAIDILLQRKPDWTSEWFAAQIEGTTWRTGLCWCSAKRLFDAGLCEKADSVAFARFIHQVSLSPMVQQDPEVIALMWQLFKYPVGFWILNGAFRKFPDSAPKNTWAAGPERIYQLVCKGLLDRQRVIDEILQAVWRDFNNMERSGMAKLYEALDVTEDEIVARQTEHFRLCSHEAPAIVSLALKCIKGVKQHPQLDTQVAIESLSPVMSIRAKSQPIAALGLLKLFVDKNNGLLAEAINVACSALVHTETDVQSAALDLLEKWSKSTTIPFEMLEAAAATASPTLRPRIKALVSGLNHESAEPLSEDNLRDSINEIQQSIQGLPESVCGALRLRESLEAVEKGLSLPEIDLSCAPFCRNMLTPVSRINDFEELIDTMNALIEDISSPMDVERVLDGIQSIGSNYPDDFDLRVAPIAARIAGPHSSWTVQRSIMTFPRLFRLMIRWMQRNKGPVPGELDSAIHRLTRSHSLAIAAVDDRLKEIEHRITSRAPALPLLALPSYDHGWIEPTHLIERLIAYESAGQTLPIREFETALLRLIPHARFPEHDLAQFTESTRCLLLFASGERDEQTASRLDQFDRQQAPLWLAAARYRDHRGALPELAPLGVPRVAFGTEAATVQWHLENASTARDLAYKEVMELRKLYGYDLDSFLDPYEPGLSSEEVDRRKRLKAAKVGAALGNGSVIEFQPTLGKATTCDCLPIALGSRTTQDFGGFCPPWAQKWLSTHWPNNCDGSYGAGLSNMLTRYDANASSLDATPSAIEPLLWPELPWTELAMQTLWLSAMCKASDITAVAKDALIEGILDGRAQPQPLARALLSLLHVPWHKMNRLASVLNEAARVSLWSTLVVNEILEAVVQAWTEVPRDGHLLLELLLEGLTKLQAELTPEAVAALKQIKPKGKSVKLTTSLMKLEREPTGALINAARLEGVRARMRRTSVRAAGQ